MTKYCSSCQLAFDAINPVHTLCPDCRAKSGAMTRYSEKLQRLRDEGICPRCRERPAAEGHSVCHECLEKERRKRRAKLESASYGLMRASDKPARGGVNVNGYFATPDVIHMASVCSRYTVCGRNDARCGECRKKHGGGECLFLRVMADDPAWTETALIKTVRALTQLAYGLLIGYSEKTQKEQTENSGNT